ncbi:hypothetical protein N0V84_008184 [Fusarium piperis]|uniref:Uncharacterized protein n=1 Tax=Fusarium piperis TaxID=1435070 RepID=A0A9W8W8K3_9HYPO|nr:hypothetical protein N0V84_008184 [Fusarium piperis]
MAHKGIVVHFPDAEVYAAEDEFEIIDYLSFEELMDLEYLDHNTIADLFLLFPLGSVSIDQLGRVQPDFH